MAQTPPPLSDVPAPSYAAHGQTSQEVNGRNFIRFGFQAPLRGTCPLGSSHGTLPPPSTRLKEGKTSLFTSGSTEIPQPLVPPSQLHPLPHSSRPTTPLSISRGLTLLANWVMTDCKVNTPANGARLNWACVRDKRPTSCTGCLFASHRLQHTFQK